ncbi:hypothetical protein [Blastococcus sp. URHD0036]|uniref:hypothetical protein n=1 Tax=Blastococcus sp. URHD0036 TaxID=1380356 RepID=UPI000494F12A|nr:hypothetical protein [Blastococcus sp. URHD0036]
MADVPPPSPGDLTVPPWFGWETVAGVLLLVLVVLVGVALLAAARAGRADRSEWEALLQARSNRRQDPAEPAG